MCSSAVYKNILCLLQGPKDITKLTLCSLQYMTATNLTLMCKYYSGVFGYNLSPHSPALHSRPCRLSLNITRHKCSSASVHKTDRTDKQIFIKFDIGEFYEKLLCHFNLQID